MACNEFELHQKHEEKQVKKLKTTIFSVDEIMPAPGSELCEAVETTSEEGTNVCTNEGFEKFSTLNDRYDGIRNEKSEMSSIDKERKVPESDMRCCIKVISPVAQGFWEPRNQNLSRTDKILEEYRNVTIRECCGIFLMFVAPVLVFTMAGLAFIIWLLL